MKDSLIVKHCFVSLAFAQHSHPSVCLQEGKRLYEYRRRC
jgi:hypothetical protein